MGKNENTVAARPKSGHKDPLAEGVRLHNVSNSSDAKTYEASQNEVTAARAKVGGPVSAPVKQAHKTKNSSKAEQAEIAKGRVEPDGPDPDIDDTPEKVEVPERTEKELADDNKKREDALAKDRKVFGK